MNSAKKADWGLVGGGVQGDQFVESSKCLSNMPIRETAGLAVYILGFLLAASLSIMFVRSSLRYVLMKDRCRLASSSSMLLCW